MTRNDHDQTGRDGTKKTASGQGCGKRKTSSWHWILPSLFLGHPVFGSLLSRCRGSYYPSGLSACNDRTIVPCSKRT